MAKQGEIEYLNAIGEGGRRHAAGRPFTDQNCGQYLARFGQVMAHLPDPPARVLDMGCGTGWTSAFLARRGYDVTGVDIAPDMVRTATENHTTPEGESLTFTVADYETVDFAEAFDAVVFFDSLHHAEDEQAALRCAFRALRSGGICVVSEPGIGHDEAPASRRATEQFNVNEKEMPPTRVRRLAASIGFTGMRTYAHQGQIFDLLNLPSSSQRTGVLGWVLRRGFLRPLVAVALIAVLKHWSGVVVLTRP